MYSKDRMTRMYGEPPPHRRDVRVFGLLIEFRNAICIDLFTCLIQMSTMQDTASWTDATH